MTKLNEIEPFEVFDYVIEKCIKCNATCEAFSESTFEQTHHKYDVTGKFNCKSCGAKYEMYYNKVAWSNVD